MREKSSAMLSFSVCAYCVFVFVCVKFVRGWWFLLLFFVTLFLFPFYAFSVFSAPVLRDGGVVAVVHVRKGVVS